MTRRTTGSVFAARRLNHQSGNSTVIPSRNDTFPFFLIYIFFTRSITFFLFETGKAISLEEAYDKIRKGLDKAREEFNKFLRDRANPEKIKAAASSLKKVFVELPRQELYNIIDQQISVFTEIRTKELEKKEVFAKIEAILTAEELLLIRFNLTRLKYDSSFVMRFPLVKIQNKQITHFLVEERLKLKRKYIIQMGTFYKKEGKEIDTLRIKQFVNSDKVKQDIGSLDNKRILVEWTEWLKRSIKGK